MEPVSLFGFVGLGWLTGRFLISYGRYFRDMLSELEQYQGLLRIYGFEKEQADLDRLVADVRQALASTEESYDRRLDSSLFQRLHEIAFSVHQSINSQLEHRKVILVNDDPVIGRLYELRSQSKDASHKVIITDTIRCLQAGAFRASIVMGWNLTYEHVRQWIYKSKRKRLKQFNGVLTTKNKSANVKYDPIKDYDDFYLLGEKFVLCIAYEAGLLTKQYHQILENALTDRNHFAHPSNRKATASTASGYLDNLIANILTEAHFAIR